MIKIYDSKKMSDSDIFAREVTAAGVEDIVAAIIADVRENGDKALLAYTKKFDKAELKTLEVTKEEIEAAYASVEPSFRRILKKSAANIKAYHKHQIKKGFRMKKADGIILGQKVTPLEKAGIYVPGGTAAYPSTVLMDCIPAKLAGVDEVIMVTPPSADGTVNPAILSAAKVAGVDRIFKIGGAQAVAALAYGTESVPAVDKIVGPGNAFVAEAKRQVFGKVAIDMIAGPSEILIISDGKTDPRWVAADLLSQAEHDKMASAVLVTDSMELAKAVQTELEVQLEALPRREIARVSIDGNGKIIVCEDLDAVIEMSNRIAPEHLEVCVDEPFKYLDKIRNAGSIFLGRYCPEALGDYYAGPNHTLPTSGTARFSSPLSVDDFVKKSAFSYYEKGALEKAYRDVATFARKEGLDAHALSAEARFKYNE